MIRPLTLCCVLLAAGSGLYLYQTKHQAQLLDRQIRHVREATEATLIRAGALRAEYALLNDPDHLTDLAARYLPNLRSTQPTQWTSMAELDRRLPPVGPPEPQEPPAAPPTLAARSEPPHVATPPAALAAVTPPPSRPNAAAQLASLPVARSTPRPSMQAARALIPPASAAPAALPPVATPPPAPLFAAAAPPAVQVAHGFASSPPTGTVLYTPRNPARLAPAEGTVFAARAEPYPAPPASVAAVMSRIAQSAMDTPPAPTMNSALGMARSVIGIAPANAGTLYPQSALR